MDNTTKISVVIPAFKEEALHLTLSSLDSCIAPNCGVEIIIINNLPDGSDRFTVESQTEVSIGLRLFSFKSSFLSVKVLDLFDLPKETFGAGLARKIGMDIASSRFYDINRPEGIIVSLDADCCAREDYFVAIEKYFSVKSRNAASIYFEHPLSGNLPEANYLAIVQYELHLRYYNLMLKFIGFPNAFQTVGSSIAFKAQAYVLAGGMSKKIAGEDFYFIQKLLSLGGYGDILTTVVYPSSRVSSRVLFGTGAAITKFVNESATEFYTFNIEPFLHLKSLFDVREQFFLAPIGDWPLFVCNLDSSLVDFFRFVNILTEIEKLRANCSSLLVFQKRFFSLFDGLLIVRYLNFAHENFVTKIPVFEAAIKYLHLSSAVHIPSDLHALLHEFRRIELNSGKI